MNSMKLHRLRSFEEYEAAVVNVDLNVRLLGPADGPWQIGHADIDGIVIQQGIETVANLCEASGSPAHLMFLISNGSPEPTWLNGVAFRPGLLGILAPGRGFVFRAIGPNRWMTIAIPLSSALFRGDDETAAVLRSWTRSTQMLQFEPILVEALHQAALVAAAPDTPPPAGRALMENAVAALIRARSVRTPMRGRPGMSRHEMCDATLEILRVANGAKPDLVEFDRLSFSARSLRGFFQQCFGCGPTHYLHLRQLHAVYAALKGEAMRKASIAEIFDRESYPYSNYSLARYRAIFGESPSETRMGSEAP
ncbi:helix-turn-helix domain-containing protein [Achromobacter pestifer]